ncbi:MAG: cytochrome c [Candidatus Sumerlaeota bacterium]|nr:cytochrome c [Candidatus Sumerlaeota bacterium]
MKESTKNFLRFGAGLLIGALLMALVPLAILATGAIDMSAACPPTFMERGMAPWALDCSMGRHAPRATNPDDNDPNAASAGLEHYRANCVMCHGAPDVNPAELAEGLNPPAPKLETDDAQSLTDGQMFWVVKNGIRMTGMPAFGKTHEDREIWQIVTFLRHLPKLTDDEKHTLELALAEDHHHEESHGAEAAHHQEGVKGEPSSHYAAAQGEEHRHEPGAEAPYGNREDERGPATPAP